MGNVLKNIKKIFTGGSGSNSGGNSKSLNDFYFNTKWKHPAIAGAKGGSTAFGGVIWIVPWYITKDVTVTDMGSYVYTSIAGSNIRMGLYNDDGTGLPGTLIEDSGDMSGTVAGFKSFTFTTPVNLLASNKLYWLAIETQNGPGVYGVSYVSGATAQNSVDQGHRVYATAYAAMPANLTGLTTVNSSGPPLVWLKNQ